jgi:hypothetical protein
MPDSKERRDKTILGIPTQDVSRPNLSPTESPQQGASSQTKSNRFQEDFRKQIIEVATQSVQPQKSPDGLLGAHRKSPKSPKSGTLLFVKAIPGPPPPSEKKQPPQMPPVSPDITNQELKENNEQWEAVQYLAKLLLSQNVQNRSSSIQADQVSAYIRENFKFEDGNVIYKRDLALIGIKNLFSLPNRMVIAGNLSLISNDDFSEFPSSIAVEKNLQIMNCRITNLPQDFYVGGDVKLQNVEEELKEAFLNLKREGKIKGDIIIVE